MVHVINRNRNTIVICQSINNLYTFPLLMICVNANFFFVMEVKNMFFSGNIGVQVKFHDDDEDPIRFKPIDVKNDDYWFTFLFVFNRNIWRSLTLSHRNWLNSLFDNENFEGWYRWNWQGVMAIADRSRERTFLELN